MNAARRRFVVRRIVVAADSSAHGRAALETAAALGQRLSAQVEGVFVEDIDLVNLSQLPLGREVHPISGRVREFDSETLEAELRHEANQARRVLEKYAGAGRLHYSFRVVRGRVDSEVIAAAGEGDLLILGAAGHSSGTSSGPGSTAVAAAMGAPRSVMVLRPGARMPERPLVAFDGSDGAELAVDAALGIADTAKRDVTVLLVAAAGADEAALRRRLDERFEGSGAPPHVIRVDTLELDRMCGVAHDVGADILVLSADSPTLADDGARRLIQRLPCPILLVR